MKAVRTWIDEHRKIVVYVVGAALSLAIEKWGTGNEWVSLGILLATGFGVYEAPNEPVAAAAPAPAEVPDPPASSSGE
jgi:hypothetical protein